MSAFLFPPEQGAVFLAAVSGGADSTAMLTALAALRRERPFTLRCLHINHGIRSEQECLGDVLAVRELCGKLAVPCKVVTIPRGRVLKQAKMRGTGVEAAARFYRHAIWRDEARRLKVKRSAVAVRILVAHTRDDLLETALMRFLRGSGPAGLGAMPRSKGPLLRPLLDLSRTEVLSYLGEKGISYCTDSTNADKAYLRNRIRLELIPLLDASFPGWRKGVYNFAETQAFTAAFLSGEASRSVKWEGAGGFLSAGRGDFFSAPEIIREEALYQGADLLAREKREGLGPDVPGRGREVPRRESVRRFSRGGAKALDLGPFRAEDRNGRVLLSSRKRASGQGERGFSLLIEQCGQYRLGELQVKVEEAFGDEAGTGGFFSALPLVLRPFNRDDEIPGRSPVPDEALVRSGFSGYTHTRPFWANAITAEDSRGIAACIGLAACGADVHRDGVMVFTRREVKSREDRFLVHILAGKPGG
ncbi:MAG: tRNA lysidine(34) synthetase TilS [Treponema sp.]|nr:tRNA lysidine(34) synthetase TilS [Treponema sp.]